ncbi:type III pantothenate kinase [uncultured Abyssibacter sp.]|uniref:type III pantothenate kinase n=1 Tax=uncultured Abyssibacter sp. TaxID=2320202 RepID=UPI0032B20DE0
MKWLLDLGNTRCKSACWLGGELLEPRSADCGEDAVGSVLDQLAPGVAPAAIWVSSVAGQAVDAAVIAWCERRGWPEPVFARSRSLSLGVRCAYADPRRLGVDRWMVVLAAAATGRDAIIVDAGTACTIDAVTAEGQHLGGLILPGVALARQSLNQRTQFKADDVTTVPLPIVGDDTNPAVTVGAVHALLGAIERVRRQLGWRAPLCVLTGGEAPLLQPHLGDEWELRPHYVLEGVARLADAADAPGEFG